VEVDSGGCGLEIGDADAGTFEDRSSPVSKKECLVAHSAKPRICSDSASLINAGSIAWGTLASPLYMYSTKDLRFSNSISFIMTIGYLLSRYCVLNMLLKYGLHADNMTRCAFNACPPAKRVTSTNDSSSRSVSKTEKSVDL